MKRGWGQCLQPSGVSGRRLVRRRPGGSRQIYLRRMLAFQKGISRVALLQGPVGDNLTSSRCQTWAAAVGWVCGTSRGEGVTGSMRR